ncbi:MAG TPA: DinB family protein [Blastocatellia bacterium]|nr:DinB family protein [Blastocatellia bacterium]
MQTAKRRHNRTMSNSLSTRPAPDEYAPFYGRYIALVPANNIIVTLRQQMADTLDMLASLTEQQALYRYSPEKWSIKEVIGHIIDSERVFAYRALRFARNDKTALPGFEENEYVMNGGFNDRQISDLGKEYEAVRKASISLFEGLGEQAWARRGSANESEVSVRALAWIISGHELHHKGVIRTRYLETMAV